MPLPWNPNMVSGDKYVTSVARSEQASHETQVIIDEAHHALAASYKKLWKMYPGAKRLGVTATPWRMNHQSFLDLFDRLVLSMPIKEFIRRGYLAPYKYFSLQGDSDIQKTIDGIEVDRFGEYKESSMEEKMDIGSIRAQLYKENRQPSLAFESIGGVRRQVSGICFLPKVIQYALTHPPKGTRNPCSAECEDSRTKFKWTMMNKKSWVLTIIYGKMMAE